jgi:hypothetical protein
MLVIGEVDLAAVQAQYLPTFAGAYVCYESIHLPLEAATEAITELVRAAGIVTIIVAEVHAPTVIHAFRGLAQDPASAHKILVVPFSLGKRNARWLIED